MGELGNHTQEVGVLGSRPVVGEPPRGSFQVKVDDRGRLKLPAPFHKYLIRQGDEKVFVTTLDRKMVRIYPLSVWKWNEGLLTSYSGNPRAAQDVSLIANHYGADSGVDELGRILLPDLLRRELNLEKQSVWLEHSRGRFNLYTDQNYQERLGQAMEGLGEKIDQLERSGLL